MTERELENKISQLRAALEATDGYPEELRYQCGTPIEQDLDHYRQRLANLRAGYGDSAVVRRCH